MTTYRDTKQCIYVSAISGLSIPALILRCGCSFSTLD